MKSAPLLLLRAALAALAFTSARLPAAEPARRWQLDSFRAFSEGTLPDGGVNIYTAADGSVRLINAFDFNRDGLPDIFLPCSHAHGEMIDLSIYWDQPGYSPEHVTRLPTEGGKDAAVADLNRDGFPDLVVVSNYNGTKTDLNAYIYWGAKDGFHVDRRSTLPTQGAEAVALADLNGDGWPEIVIANSGLTYHVAIDKTQASYIYWNDHGRFAPDHKSNLPSINGRDVAIADLDGDGAPDIVLVSAGNDPAEAGARIFWSRPGGYDAAHSLFLPGEGCAAVALGDLNRDGRPDLVLANSQRLKGREGGIYDIVDTVQLDSFIYWNSAEGFDPVHRTGLPTVGASDVAIGDLDGDGRPDVVFANGEGDASFVYWSSPEGFLPRRRLALPTSNARAVTATDLDHDGHLDLVFANSNRGSQFDIESFIYRGGPQGPDAGRRQSLPTSGASAIVVADLKNQKRTDLIFINKQDGTGGGTPGSLYLSARKNPSIFTPAQRIEVAGPDGYSASDLNLDGRPDLVGPGGDGVSIYWGSESGYQLKTRTPITSNSAFSSRLADFNRDGYLDAMLSEWQPGSQATHLYYGGPDGFSSAARTALPVGGIRYHTIADFNNDGWIDVAYPVFNEEKVTIFWNSPSGFTASHRTDLPGRSAVALEAADLNGDGYLDLIVPNLFDKNPPPDKKTRAFGGSPEGDVFIYWGAATGYSNERRATLPAIGAEDAAVADLNNDGRLDLVITSYHGGDRRNYPSYVYWQGPNGFTPDNVTMLETNSASGILTTDFNADGWTDLLFANHHKNGSHRNDSYLYWGGPQGFSAARRLDLPANGPHFMTIVDPGNVYDRRPRFHYVSPARKFAAAKQLRAISWTADTPPGTAVYFQLRSASSAETLLQAAWEGPKGKDSEFARPADTAGHALHGPWVQFRAILDNPGGGLPVLRSVTLDFE